MGAAAGGVSLLVFPDAAIHDIELRKINALATPVIVGTVMMLIGIRRNRKGQVLVGLDRFVYAFIFALAMALIRLQWAK